MIDNMAVSEVIGKIQEFLGDRVSINETICEQHGHDESWFAPSPPDAVCFVETADEVSRIVRLCNEWKVPVIPFGAGSGVAGLVNAIHGGLSIDLSRMTDIIAVRPEDADCTVQAGVTRQKLNSYLRDTGLFFSVDPGAEATLGGMAATRASGTNTVRYGTMRENVLSMKVVLPNGEIIETGTRAKKSSASYDLTHLFVGTEGTLGIIVELTLRLHGIPAATSTAVVQFDNVGQAVNSVVLALQMTVPVARIELVDQTLIRAMNDYSNLDLKIADCLFVEFHGTENGVQEAAEIFEEICRDEGSAGFQWTQDAEESSRLWRARHGAAWAFMALRPKSRNFSTDVCVPISKLAECIDRTREDMAANLSVVSAIAGHVGDGNFHVVCLVDPSLPEERKQVEIFYDRLIDRALSMGGTCSGEHGIGIQKLKYVQKEMGTAAINLMASIKAAVDPGNIMNPGKKFPQAEGEQK